MSLELKIVSRHATIVGEDAVREFNESGGSIGRSLQSDWILPDPERFISGRHATIDYKGGIYYLLDTSSNGVYFNNEMEPVGKGNTRRIFNGDRLRMGDFEFAVAIDSGESLVTPLDDTGSHSIQDNAEQLVDEVSLRTGIKLLDEDEIAGDNVFESALFGGDGDTAADEAGNDQTSNVDFDLEEFDTPGLSEKIDSNSLEPAQPKLVRDSRSASTKSDAMVEAFLDGLGIERRELHPSANHENIMRTAGQVLREAVSGLTELLASRADLKNTFRLEQTTVLPRFNNPLKLSENTTDLLKQLLVGGEGDYLGGQDAVRETCRDLIHHQNAFLDAMNAAFVDFADRFDPDELKLGFDSAGQSSALLGFLNGKRYWDAYCDLYPILTEKGNSRFPQMFGEEFVAAYERVVADYRRQDREGSNTASSRSLSTSNTSSEPGLLVTQKLANPAGIAAKASAVLGAAKMTPVEGVVATITNTDTIEIDQSFIDELDSQMADTNSKDRSNG